MTARPIAAAACAVLALSACTSPTIAEDDLEAAWTVVLNWDVALDHDLDISYSGQELETDVPAAQLDEWTTAAVQELCERFASPLGLDAPGFSSRGTVVDDILREHRFLKREAAQSDELSDALDEVRVQASELHPLPPPPDLGASETDWDAHMDAWNAVSDVRNETSDRLFAEQYPDLAAERAAYDARTEQIRVDSVSDGAIEAAQVFVIDKCGFAGTEAVKTYPADILGVFIPAAAP